MKLEKKAGQQMLYEQSLSLTQMAAFSFQNDNSEKGGYERNSGKNKLVLRIYGQKRISKAYHLTKSM